MLEIQALCRIFEINVLLLIGNVERFSLVESSKEVGEHQTEGCLTGSWVASKKSYRRGSNARFLRRAKTLINYPRNDTFYFPELRITQQDRTVINADGTADAPHATLGVDALVLPLGKQ